MAVKKVLMLFGALVGSVYMGFPLVAGFIGIGERNGPKVYMPFHHEMLYSLGYSFNSKHVDKPRVNVFLERPIFYGGKRDLKERYKHDPKAIEILRIMEEERKDANGG